MFSDSSLTSKKKEEPDTMKEGFISEETGCHLVYKSQNKGHYSDSLGAKYE
jgi:hypothetical protein